VVNNAIRRKLEDASSDASQVETGFSVLATLFNGQQSPPTRQEASQIEFVVEAMEVFHKRSMKLLDEANSELAAGGSAFRVAAE
jgi:hypothetical protein